MSKNYYDGDVEITELTVTSSRSSIDLKTGFISASVYESIFTPGIVCDIRVNDMNDNLGEARLLGDETVRFTFFVKGSETASYIFALHELSELENVGAQSGKSYTLKCVSEEAMFARTNLVQKSYNMLCSEIVTDLYKNYLKGVKPLITEETSTPQRIIIPSKSPYQAINMIKQRAVSSSRISSFYLFFENRQNEEQTFNFVTVENLFEQNPIKNFRMDNTINTSLLKKGDENILAFRIPTQFSSTDRIAYGGPRNIVTFNFTTWEYESRIIQTDETQFRGIGGNTSLTSQEFRNRYYTSDTPPQTIVPVDISQRPETFIPQAAPNVQAMLALLLQNSIRIKTIGDTVLTAGKTIDCELPNRQSFTGNRGEDPLITGKFLISRIHHRIGQVSDKPRYTCSIEGLKGRYEE